ncbi:PP2C family serine/threonine-protein phosphatase [Belnapia rosea]|uniref:PP2C family serine/threonine-protein phosphatase n=1 Tax=Belnapia rosea TaxID=938405 RepID=UPI0008849743|nr:PP2C family serine/threonine-protein phosphatase [Belnapia rosea]SDB22043.1 Protein phosphatase 2C [Belnapia rosea]
MTTGRSWRTAYASSIGTSHQKSGTPCQDAGGCRVVKAADGREVLVIGVSDGAGTAKRSDIGSALVVESFLERFAEAAATSPDLKAIDRKLVDEWFDDVRDSIGARAAQDGAEPNDYACTLLGAVVGPEAAAYVQIGDGAIVVSSEEASGYSWIFWPQHGEYANSTYFITQDGAERVLQFEIQPAMDEIAIFSDGIERLVLDMTARTVHGPAFRPIFEWLASTEPDLSGAPSPGLAAYLGSDHVNRRTDDDKTLVMATRALPPEKIPVP